ncbi:M23 family metallopeptidase [Methylophaga sp. UBA4502]|uniref:M23 family metallopeptidase n=1 Tax=Methylophaga sp. UBA4502 TaxID=1946893 RepID=UPI0025E057EE|nr:M23 family metallopeptidase [Methylophaga sp. UBA4502]
MATQKRTRGDDGRIYRSRPADTIYQGSARSLGFNPVKAVNDEKKIRDYKAAIIADGQTISREIVRQQQAENLAFKAQQTADAGGLKLSQSGERAYQKLSQLRDTDNLKAEQLVDTNNLKLEASTLKAENTIDLGVLKANQSIDNLNFKTAQTAIQGILDFGVSVYKTKADFAEKVEAQRLEDMKYDSLLKTGVFGGQSQESIDRMNAEGEVIDVGHQAESASLGETAAEIRSSGNPFDAYQAEKLYSMSTWNQTADVRGDLFAARMLYTAVLAEANANGLIRPDSAREDIGRITLKFTEVTGIQALAASNPKFVAEHFAQSAIGAQHNEMLNVATQAATELKAVRDQKVNSNISTAFAGLHSNSTTAEVGLAWNYANAENVRGSHGGVMDAYSRQDTTIKVLKELADRGEPLLIDELFNHAPNPATPNIILGDQFRNLFHSERLRAEAKARSLYQKAKENYTIQANQIIEEFYAGDQNSETRLQAAERLSQIPGSTARSLRQNLLKFGLDYDSNVALEIANARGTDREYSVRQIQEKYDQRLINKQERDLAISLAPDAKTAAKIQEAIKEYKPQNRMYFDVKTEDGSKFTYGQGVPASQEFKKLLQSRQKRFNIELSRRMQGVLRDKRDLDPQSQEFQKLLEEEGDYLRQQPRFQIHYGSDTNYYFGQSEITDPKLIDSIEEITITPGKQNFTRGPVGGYTASGVEISGIPKAMLDPTVDIFLSPTQLKADSEKLLKGEKVSKRTHDWANSLGMSPREFVNSQRLMMDMPGLDDLRRTEGIPMPGNAPILQKPISDFRDQARGQITFDTNQPGIDVYFEDKQFPAVLSGRVKEIGSQYNENGSGYGNFVIIESIDPATGQPVDVLYAHLADRPNLSEGQSIGEGQIIGTQGGTGSVDSVDGTIASIDFLAPAPRGSKSMTAYSDADNLRRRIASYLTPGGPTSPRIPTPVAQSVTPGSKKEGMKALMAMDVPMRGAAYLASAIQHESLWNAQRSSWTLNDGAGRNGGLLSWNRGRLANLERTYGRRVEQISEAEQLKFLLTEMKVSYNDSYRVFMTPNASSQDLQAATWNYIRWNKRYTGSRWTMAEGLIRWGSNNNF